MPPTESGDNQNRDRGGSFDERLQSARRRQGQESDRTEISAGSQSHGPSALSIGLRVSVELASSLAVGTLIGWWLDRWLHTAPFLLIVFMLLGGASGVLNVWRLVGRDDASSGETVELTGRPRGDSGDERK